MAGEVPSPQLHARTRVRPSRGNALRPGARTDPDDSVIGVVERAFPALSPAGGRRVSGGKEQRAR